MRKADNPGMAAGQSSFDILIIGGGIMGLWAGVHAERRGIRTLLVDAGTPGCGASGGLLGALMPYMPDGWMDKKQFQFDALVELGSEIAAVEAETGLSAGYRRCGRLIPLPKPHLRTIALRHSADALRNWHQGGHGFFWNVIDEAPVDGWIDPGVAASGFVYDTLAARVSPRGLTGMLTTFLKASRHVTVLEQTAISSLDPVRGVATTGDGQDIRFGHCVVAAGVGSFAFLQDIGAPLPRPLGQAVKGQAALLAADIDPAFPVIFRDGLYVVPHEDGRVAIGSTSENTFADPLSIDAQLEVLIDAAGQVCPGLDGATVLERWAGLRPKAIDRDPMVGPHPEHPTVIALTGGFKISFGLAHRLAAVAVNSIAGAGDAIMVPRGFTLASHMAVASRIA